MSDYQIIRLADYWPISLAATTARAHFIDEDGRATPDAKEYQTRVAAAQHEINKRGVGGMIAYQIRSALTEMAGQRHVFLQNGVYLRAARPWDDSEVLDWHRESMYGARPGTLNVWAPIANVDERNALRYIPGTADVSDEDVRGVDEDGMVEQNSPGHAIGLLYRKKRIVSINGEDEFAHQAKSMIVPDGHVAIFPGSLIHGAARNRSNKIRFSVDMRVVPLGAI